MKFTKLIIASLVLCLHLPAQDSLLLQQLEDSLNIQSGPDYALATFKATQIINTPTIESPGKGNLQLLIMHRFGKINEGAYALFGLDNASIRLGLDYGITNKLAVGIGRSSLDKTFDGSIKWKLLRQAKNRSPVSVSLYGLIAHTTLRHEDKSYLTAKYKTSYATEVLIARKMGERLSLQLAPTWLHFNLVPTPADKNDMFALSFGGRMKLTKSMSINAEYNWLTGDPVVSTKIYNSLSLGLDMETGGHVFQLIFTNSGGMIGPWYLAKTTGSWGNGDIYFGFNISRSFSFGKKKKSAGKW